VPKKHFTDYKGTSPISTTLKVLSSILLSALTTYLLTPCSRVLVEKLTGIQLVKRVSAYYGI